MTTFKVLQDRICLDYLNRMTLIPETKRAIQASIRNYEGTRYWFNEAQTAMASSSSLSYVTVPSDFLVLDRLEARIGGILTPLRETDFLSLRDMSIAESRGAPAVFAYRNDRFEIFPIPDSAYTVTVYYIKTLATLSADADTNAWTNEASNLIAHAACVDLLSGVLQADSASINRHVAMTQRAEYELNLRNVTRISRSLRPTSF